MEQQQQQQQQSILPFPDGMPQGCCPPFNYHHGHHGYNSNPRGGFNRGPNRPSHYQRGFRGRGSSMRGSRSFQAPALPPEGLGPEAYFMTSFLQDPWKELLEAEWDVADPNDLTDPRNYVMQSFFEDPWCVLLSSSSPEKKQKK